MSVVIRTEEEIRATVAETQRELKQLKDAIFKMDLDDPERARLAKMIRRAQVRDWWTRYNAKVRLHDGSIIMSSEYFFEMNAEIKASINKLKIEGIRRRKMLLNKNATYEEPRTQEKDILMRSVHNTAMPRPSNDIKELPFKFDTQLAAITGTETVIDFGPCISTKCVVYNMCHQAKKGHPCTVRHSLPTSKTTVI